MEAYRSGHNEPDSKSGCPQGHVGSNPTASATDPRKQLLCFRGLSITGVTFMFMVFVLNLALLFVHEMDAVRHQEWRMFIILKDLSEKNAYRAFAALHIPLYAAVLFLLLSAWQFAGMLLVDVFLLAHTGIHFGFRKHPANGFQNRFSNGLIYGMGALSLLHLLWLLLPSIL